MADKKRIGRQTPTASYILPYKKTISKEAVKLYELSGQKLFDWQKNVLNDLMAVNQANEWIHMQFGGSVPRQNGKNEIIATRELYGLCNGEKILHTAHLADTSHKAWERLMYLVEQSELPVKSSLKTKGGEKIVIDGGGYIDFRTRTSSGGRGGSYDTVIVDEAQEYTEEQDSALSYTLTASKNPQIILFGTPPDPDTAGTVFTDFRNKTLAGENEDTGWAEWSVSKVTDNKDIEAWYETNPSLGLLFSERNIRAQTSKDQLLFNIERLGYWVEYNLKSAISEIEWDALCEKKQPQLIGDLYVGVKYNIDGLTVALSVASLTADNKVFVESVDCRPVRAGNGWIIDFLSKMKKYKVVVDGASGQQILKDEMQANKIKIPIFPKVADIIKANSEFEQGVNLKTIIHMGQPSLKQIATNIDKRAIGTNGGFGYKSILEGADVALIDSVILAHWLCLESKGKRKQKISY